MHWLNEPARWAGEGGRLAVTADPGTGFWRTTGYGYVRDNGHLYGDMLAGDFDLGMSLTGAYAHQHDQAGAMVRPASPPPSAISRTPVLTTAPAPPVT